MKISNQRSQHNQRIRIQKPQAAHEGDEEILEDVRKYLRMIPSEPEPNMGRIKEIKEEIRRGTYLNKDMIEEAASQLAIRLMRGGA